MKNIIAIIQARLDSTRLPGKVLLGIAGKPMLEWVVERTRRSRLITNVVVATTEDPSDDGIEEFCGMKRFPVRRGSVFDVLDRYYQTANHYKADIVVRITADCPLIDPELIDEALRLMLNDSLVDSSQGSVSTYPFDFVANRLPLPWGRTYPIGLDVEVFTYDIMKEAWMKTTEKFQREHVAPYFYQDASIDHLKYCECNVPFAQTLTPKGHHIALMHHVPDYGHLRWTVDTMEDLELVRVIAEHFKEKDFGWQEVVELTQSNPEINQINAHIQHKTHLDVDQRNVGIYPRGETDS